MVQGTTPSLQAWFCLQEIHSTMKTGIALSQETEHFFVMKMIFAWRKQRKNQNRIKSSTIYHTLFHQNCWRTGDGVFHAGKVTPGLYKKNRLEADAFKTELHTSVARWKLSLVFLTMTPQYQSHIWFFQSALLLFLECLLLDSCLSGTDIWLFNSSLQHLCATIKVYPRA